jgi:hypothetical protein
MRREEGRWFIFIQDTLRTGLDGLVVFSRDGAEEDGDGAEKEEEEGKQHFLSFERNESGYRVWLCVYCGRGIW